MKVKAVFDTNTLISGLLFKGNESQLLELVESGCIELFISAELSVELENVLDYPRVVKVLIRQQKNKEGCLLTVAKGASLVEPRVRVDVIADGDDNRVLECAVEAGAEYIVSGDSHLLDLKSYKGVQIVSSTRMLEILEKN
jgi:putative PIN family toxin of toxin-antitoxin system